jgi:urease accessory protein
MKLENTMRLAAVAAMAGLALPAMAHPGHAADSGAMAGLLHPLSGLDHLLALLAVGMWSRRQRHGGVLPTVFLVWMALGSACAGMLSNGALPALEASIAASVLLLGGLALAAPRLAPPLAVMLVGVCGFPHGLAHGRELAGMASGAGFLAASALVMGMGMLMAPGGRRLASLVRLACGRLPNPARPGGSAPHPLDTSPARPGRPR